MTKFKFSQKQISQFKKMGINTIYLFGSQAQGYTHPMSDIDIGVVFDKPEKYKDKTMPAYLKLYDIFTDVFPERKQIDIIFLQLTGLSLQFNAVKSGQVLYEADQEHRFKYQEDVFKKYADFKYFYDMQYNAILKRI